MSDPTGLGPMAAFAEREYDLTSRHLLVARIVTELVPTGERLLDIGGADGLTAPSLPSHRVFVVDVRSHGVDAVASGAALPFKDGTFAAAVALDVLEHVNDSLKEEIVRDATRIADLVIIAGPFDSAEVRAAEEAQRDAFEAMFDKPHPWLSEHYASGLPSAAAVIEQLGAADFATMSFGSNPLGLWSELLFQTHIALRMGYDEATREPRRQLLEHFLDRADATPPGYRQIIVAARDSSLIDQVVPLVPGTDEVAVTTAMVEARTIVGKVIASGMDLLDQSRRDMDAGWKNTIAALESVRRQATLADSLEARLVADIAMMDLAVAGPPVTEASHGVAPEQAAADYKGWVAAHRAPDPPPSGPLFSVLTPVFNPTAEFLEACIRSVRAQTYQRWELVLMNVSTDPHVAPICQRFAALDDRIKLIEDDNNGIALNTNAAAAAATGDWVVLLDHDDELAPHALAAVAIAIGENPQAGYVYSDEDKIDEAGHRSSPFFKPDWSPDLLMMVNYVSHLAAIRRDVWDDIGGERDGFHGAQDFDMALRATEATGHAIHVPDVLYHWRIHEGSTASDVRVKPEAHRAGRRALEDFVNRTVPDGWVDIGPRPTSHRVRFPVRSELVSIIVPFRDRAELTTACLEALDNHRSDLPFEVLAVSNRSTETETRTAAAEWQQRWDWLRVVEFDEPFNYHRLNNWAVTQTEGPLLIFLNNDTEPLHREWVEAMVEHAQRPEIGAVGARLFYPDGLIQHAGVFVGIGGFAGHPWARLHPDDWPPNGPSYWTRNFLAVTAACLMIERSKFNEVGGFDERFTVGGGDVDLGIRLVEAGYRNLMTPFARLVHKESLTRGTAVPAGDLEESLRSYGPYLKEGDPFASPNITLEDTSCRIRPVA